MINKILPNFIIDNLRIALHNAVIMMLNGLISRMTNLM